MGYGCRNNVWFGFNFKNCLSWVLDIEGCDLSFVRHMCFGNWMFFLSRSIGVEMTRLECAYKVTIWVLMSKYLCFVTWFRDFCFVTWLNRLRYESITLRSKLSLYGSSMCSWYVWYEKVKIEVRFLWSWSLFGSLHCKTIWIGFAIWSIWVHDLVRCLACYFEMMLTEFGFRLELHYGSWFGVSLWVDCFDVEMTSYFGKST